MAKNGAVKLGKDLGLMAGIMASGLLDEFGFCGHRCIWNHHQSTCVA